MTTPPPKPTPSSPQDAVHLQGGWRTNDPGGGYTVSAQSGTTLRHLPDGNIEGRMSSIHAVAVLDLSKVTRHVIAHVYDTISHTLHFVGGGTLSYLHARNGHGYELSGHNIAVRVNPDGGIVVLGSTSEHGDK